VSLVSIDTRDTGCASSEPACIANGDDGCAPSEPARAGNIEASGDTA